MVCYRRSPTRGEMPSLTIKAMPINTEVLFATLEKLGEDEVHRKLAIGDYGPHDRPQVALVKEWLRKKAQERVDAESLRNDASSREQMDIARSAKDAAWEAARAAKAANTRATIALAIAAISIIVAIISFFVPRP